jgi:hypothetical protein
MRFLMLAALECYREKEKEITFADRPKQSKRDVVHSMIGTGIDQIANFVYAEKHKCQSTLTNQSHADRR